MDDVTAHVRGGCAQERGAVDERCGASREARQAHDAAAEQGREIRRRLTAARHALDEATEAADTRRRHELKERAQAAFKGERATAPDDAARAEAAARWARAVDAINRDTRIAVRALAQAKRVVASLETDLRAADASEQSLRVAAESAESACLDARVRLASCEERAQAPQVAPIPATAALAMAQGASVVPPPTVGGAPVGGAAARSVAVAEATVATAPRAGDRPLSGFAPRAPAPQTLPPGPGARPRIGQGTPTVIEALLSGDRGWMERTASALAETVGRGAPEVFARLRELVEALVATAASRGYVMVDTSHELWSRLTADEARDVLAALTRLGFQVEPREGWQADRAPVQSDLSMALAYAGLDARSLRHLPSNAQLRELPRSIAVDTRGLLVNEAPDLALDHVVRMLDHRADALGPLWDDWGYVRPLLLSDPGSLP
jgi:hypothetical protein